MKRPVSIEATIIRKVQAVVLTFWCFFILILGWIGASAYKNSERENVQYVESYARNLVESYASSNDHFAIQRELQRFSSQFEKSRNHQIALEVFLNDQLLASSARGKPGIFATPISVELVTPSSEKVKIRGFVDFSSWVKTVLAVAFGVTALFVFLLISLQYFLKRAIRSVTLRLSAEVNEIRELSDALYGNLASKSPIPTNLVEVNSLQESTSKLTTAIISYRKELELQKRLAAEAEARSASLKTVSLMAQMLAHDVKRPMTFVAQLFEEAVMSENPEHLKKVAAAYLPMTKEALSQAEEMIEDTIQLGAMSFEKISAVDLSSLFDAYKRRNPQALLALHGAAGCSVAIDCSAADRLISNLLDNAVEASGPERPVEIQFFDLPSEVSFEIKNRGSSLTEEELSRIFEPFYTRGKARGTGLGLTVCKKVVSDAGGKIEACSDGESWVSFCVTLPKATFAPVGPLNVGPT